MKLFYPPTTNLTPGLLAELRDRVSSISGAPPDLVEAVLAQMDADHPDHNESALCCPKCGDGINEVFEREQAKRKAPAGPPGLTRTMSLARKVGQGVAKDDIGDLICKHPPVLAYDVDRRLAPLFDYLAELGLDSDAAVASLSRRPNLLGLDPDLNMRRMVDYLMANGSSQEEALEQLRIKRLRYDPEIDDSSSIGAHLPLASDEFASDTSNSTDLWERRDDQGRLLPPGVRRIRMDKEVPAQVS